MKKLFKTMAILLASACCFGGLAGCKKDEAPKKTVTIGYTLYEPMNYKDASGKLVGFDTELAEKAFGDLGYTIRFKEIDWNNKYMELNSGTIDCVWNGFTANCADDDGVQRADKVDFSYYYMTNTQCVIRLSQTAELTSVEQFAGKSVSFENGSAGESYVDSVMLDEDGEVVVNINKKGVTSQMDAVKEVNAGTAQYAVVDVLLAQSLAGQGDFANLTINEGIEIAEEYYAIGFKKGSTLTAKINEKLLAYEESGYLATLATKYNLSSKLIPINK